MNTGNTGTQTAGQLYDYDVVDPSGNKIGSVDGVWVDDATDQPEFIAVKTGWLFGKNHLIPVQDAQIDDGSRTIQVPYSSDQVKNGPSFGSDDNLSPADEDQIYSYYGMDRTTAPSPTGLGTDTGTSQTTTGTTTSQMDTSGEIPSQPQEAELTTSEEELVVGKRAVQAGQVHLRKVVRTEQQEVPVELRREEVDIERVPVQGGEVPADAFQEQDITMPVMQEEAVVGKEAQVTGQYRVNKDVETQQQTVGGQVRREEVEIDRDDIDETIDTPDQT